MSAPWPPTDRDLFGSNSRASDLPTDVTAGLETLAKVSPIWPIAHWHGVVGRVSAFSNRWDGPARARGWTSLQLYGLHQRAPYANLAAMGAAWVVAMRETAVREIEADGAIVTVSRTGAPLRIYLQPPNPSAVLAWSLVPGCPPKTMP